MIGIRTARRAALALGFQRFAWKLRKLDFDIGRGELALDVGSGSAPSPYADVLVDYDPEGRETNAGIAQAHGKALIWANAQRLPFRDAVFGFVTCFHLLEHVVDPAACLEEMQRVGRRGYIETPNELFDYVIPYRDHRNRVSFDGRLLRLMRKSRWDVERFAARFGRERSRQVFDLLNRNPANLHVCYRWQGRIEYSVSCEVIDDGCSATVDDAETERSTGEPSWVNALACRIMGRQSIGDERLLTLMRCVECNGEELALLVDGHARCEGCGRGYCRLNGYLDFRPR
jgi:SAM-dependent methyltransferase